MPSSVVPTFRKSRKVGQPFRGAGGQTPTSSLPLTPPPAFCSMFGTSSFFNHLRSGPEFHAEWLRDEPCDATATDPGSYIPGAWCQLSPGNGEHGIRHASSICILNLFFLFPEKEAFVF